MRIYKYVILLGLVSCLLFIPSQAQIFGIGAKAGVNVSTLSGTFTLEENGFIPTTDFKNKTGYMVGVSLRTSLLPLISLQPEILYTIKGAKIDDGSIDFTYLEIPILLRVSLPIPLYTPAIYAGPGIAFNLDSKIKENGSFEIDIKDEIKNIDFSVILGVGFEFGLPILKGTFDLRYTGGLRDISNNNGNISLKNRTISAIVGVRF